MKNKPTVEGGPFINGPVYNEGHSDATYHMSDVAGPPAQPKGTALVMKGK